MIAMYSSLNTPGLSRSPQDPPERYSMTIQSSVPRIQEPSYLVTKGESREERIEISDCDGAKRVR